MTVAVGPLYAFSLALQPGPAVPGMTSSAGTGEKRSKNLSLTTNNTRFLILPWVSVKYLASHILSKVCQRIKDDWEHKYGHTVYLLETFVERDRFRGIRYKASNWTCVGMTKGRSRNDRYSTMKVPVKDIYLYQLVKRFRKVLIGEA